MPPPLSRALLWAGQCAGTSRVTGALSPWPAPPDSRPARRPSWATRPSALHGGTAASGQWPAAGFRPGLRRSRRDPAGGLASEHPPAPASTGLDTCYVDVSLWTPQGSPLLSPPHPHLPSPHPWPCPSPRCPSGRRRQPPNQPPRRVREGASQRAKASAQLRPSPPRPRLLEATTEDAGVREDAEAHVVSRAIPSPPTLPGTPESSPEPRTAQQGQSGLTPP